ncbi:MAG: hypothetical protein BGN88_14390 [Clostridiales bacterium 43-6]|nr:MAG: hypothetical protein BGN88_14390 [Clostridiales bacterium 43-6]
MEELFVETEKGKLPIDEKIVKKYTLKQGLSTPFTGKKIVNQKGQAVIEKPAREQVTLDDGGLDDGVNLSTSEILDLIEGTDSYT